ncbi:MAG: hypothetical protein EXR53_00240 [Dehalococcoidia bacterium]|nr:hypothetical protein [Dehalococcoidia bacterium]
MGDRLLSAIWVPVLAIIATAAIVIGVGELLLKLASLKPEMSGVKEPFSVIVALVLAVGILLGATFLARDGNSSRG